MKIFFLFHVTECCILINCFIGIKFSNYFDDIVNTNNVRLLKHKSLLVKYFFNINCFKLT